MYLSSKPITITQDEAPKLEITSPVMNSPYSNFNSLFEGFEPPISESDLQQNNYIVPGVSLTSEEFLDPPGLPYLIGPPISPEFGDEYLNFEGETDVDSDDQASKLVSQEKGEPPQSDTNNSSNLSGLNNNEEETINGADSPIQNFEDSGGLQESQLKEEYFREPNKDRYPAEQSAEQSTSDDLLHFLHNLRPGSWLCPESLDY